MSVPLADVIFTIKANETPISTKKTYSLLKKKYGKDFKTNFEALNLGKFKVWYPKNRPIFEQQRLVNVNVSEEELLEFVKEYFVKDSSFEYRRTILEKLRENYGVAFFSDFGFGEFSDFIKKHSLHLSTQGYNSSPELVSTNSKKFSPVKSNVQPKRVSSYF